MFCQASLNLAWVISISYYESYDGYLWTVMPVERREEYMQALESASVKEDIYPFTEFIASLL